MYWAVSKIYFILCKNKTQNPIIYYSFKPECKCLILFTDLNMTLELFHFEKKFKQ